MHVAVCSTGLPLNILTGLGSQHDSRKFTDVMDGVKIKVEIGRPRTKPGEVVADAAYDDTKMKEYFQKKEDI